MITPIDFSRLHIALESPRGWTELALTLVCLAFAWAIERLIERADRVRQGADAATLTVGTRRLRSVALRLAFPLIGLALVYVAASVWRRHVGPPFFLAIATPLLFTLVGIRMLVYAVRRLFHGEGLQRTSEVTIVAAAWGLAALYFLGVLADIGAALDDLVIPIGKSQVSMLSIVEGVVVLIVTMIIALWVSGWIERRLARASQIDANLRIVLGNVLRIVLVVVGALVALEMVGFDLTLLTVFGGALAVGIGLGLQKLAANYIAGFTILLDKSIRLGDLVTVDGRTGVVSKVTARYVVVRSLDGLEAIVPNETMVTTTVLNHGHTAPGIRVAVNVQVSYDSDVERALALLIEIAKRQPRVLGSARAPVAFLVGLTDNGMNLELGMWINDPQNGQLNLRSDVHRDILAEFKIHGITIPPPRRDVRIVGEPGQPVAAQPARPAAAAPPARPATPGAPAG